MKKNAKYFFNPQSLRYEKVKANVWAQVLRVFGFLSASVVFGVLVMFGSYSYLDSPKEKMLRREIANYKLQLKLINQKMEDISGMVAQLEERDDKIYRVIFEAAPIPDETRNAGIGGINRYKNLDGFESSEALKSMFQRIDKLSGQLYIQSKSYDEIAALAARKAEMLASIPAIQPVSNRNLTRMASGFGMRIHPIYKTYKMHNGMDFTAPIGTEIYVTGNGVIEKAEYSSGYGNCIVVDHGFGYKTLYAHLSAYKVKRGQKVTRGDVIGLVGSTGTSSGPHLHYEVMKNGNKVNPVNFYFNDLTPEEYDKVRLIASQTNQSFD